MLTDKSPGKKAASDGSDIGADISKVGPNRNIPTSGMIRYVVSDYVIETDGSRRPRIFHSTNGIRDYGGLIRGKTVSNVNGKTWCLVKAEFSDWKSIEGDSRLFCLFGSQLDSQAASQVADAIKATTFGTCQTKTSDQTKLTSMGVNLTGVDNNTSLYDVVNKTLLTMHPQANVDTF